MNFESGSKSSRASLSGSPHHRHELIRAGDHRPSTAQNDASGAHRLYARLRALEDRHSDCSLQLQDVAAERGLADAKGSHSPVEAAVVGGNDGVAKLANVEGNSVYFALAVKDCCLKCIDGCGFTLYPNLSRETPSGSGAALDRVIGVCRAGRIAGRGELSGKDEGAHQCQAHSLPGRRRSTPRGITDKRDTPGCPSLHADLADRVEIEVGSAAHIVKQLRHHPACVGCEPCEHMFLKSLTRNSCSPC